MPEKCPSCTEKGVIQKYSVDPWSLMPILTANDPRCGAGAAAICRN